MSTQNDFSNTVSVGFTPKPRTSSTEAFYQQEISDIIKQAAELMALYVKTSNQSSITIKNILQDGSLPSSTSLMIEQQIIALDYLRDNLSYQLKSKFEQIQSMLPLNNKSLTDEESLTDEKRLTGDVIL